MGMYDTIEVQGRGEDGFGQVKLWGRTLETYRLGDTVPKGPGGKRSYDIAMREGGFAHVREGRLVGWDDEDDVGVPLYDKWGGLCDTRAALATDYVFRDGDR